MTNEEVIKKIKSLCHGCVEFPHCVNTDPDCFKSLEMAIKALEQEPCEDCISRTQAIKAMDELENEDIEAYGCKIPEGFDGERARLAICLLPSIQPTAKENLVVGDCISREDAIANILVLFPDMPVVDIMGARRKWAEKYAQYNDCIQILREMPPVTPKPNDKALKIISETMMDMVNNKPFEEVMGNLENNMREMGIGIPILKDEEPCEDAISRQAVLDCLTASGLKKFDFILDARDKIKELPPVTPKSKTGHWILQPSNKEQGERDFIWWKCSKCGQVIYSETEQDRREYHAYCGRCGAKMLPTDAEKEWLPQYEGKWVTEKE